MARWQDFKEASPELATLGEERLSHPRTPGQGPLNFAYLATMAASGRLRLHPCCPTIANGGLYFFAESHTPKLGDLRHDGRFALHSLMWPELKKGGEFYICGRAREITDPDERALVAASEHISWDPPTTDALFELLLDRALDTTWDEGYKYKKWIEVTT